MHDFVVKPSAYSFDKPQDYKEPPNIFFNDGVGYLEASLEVQEDESGKSWIVIGDGESSKPALVCCYNKYLAQNFCKLPEAISTVKTHTMHCATPEEREKLLAYAYERGFVYLLIIAAISRKENEEAGVKFSIMKIKDWLKKKKFTCIEGQTRVKSPD